MPLEIPNLDDRKFQDLVDEMKRRIPLYCPEWTDHNVSDPGVTLIELFAWAIEQLIYRANQIPEFHYLAFLKFLGVKLPEPTPARAELIFRLSAPSDLPITIPSQTEVSTTQTELEEPIVFSTDEPYVINPAQLINIGLESAEEDLKSLKPLKSILLEIERGTRQVDIFGEKEPIPGDSFYFGFSTDLSEHLLSLELDFVENQGSGINPLNPPWIWEVSSSYEDAWVACDPAFIKDTTYGMNQRGSIELLLPKVTKRKISGLGARTLEEEQYWLRVRVRQPYEWKEKRVNQFTRSPNLKQIISVASVGRIARAANFQERLNEVLGISNGEAGQRFQLPDAPIFLPKPDEEFVEVIVGTSITVWKYQEDFSNPEAEQGCYFTLDCTTGEIRFPPALRQEDGSIKCYGQVPERGAVIRFAKYRVPGNAQKPLQAGKINQLKTSLPGVASVENHKPTQVVETRGDLELYGMQVTSYLRTRDRAVTLEDYRVLVEEKYSDRIQHAHPMLDTQHEPSRVRINLIPQMPEWARDKNTDKLDVKTLETPASLCGEIERYLNQLQLISMPPVMVRAADIRFISIRVKLKLTTISYRTFVEQALQRLLNRFLDPIQGGGNGRGWLPGQELKETDIRNVISSRTEVNHMLEKVLEIKYKVRELPDEWKDIPAGGVILDGNQVFVSDEHEIVCE